MLKLLATGVFLIMLLSCSSQNGAVDKKIYSFLALGDSYTIGESVPEAERWPVQLADSLNKEGIAVDPVKIIAKTGWTTDELAAAIEASGLSGTFDLVGLLIGVNNQYRGRSVENYRSEYIGLLETAIAFAGDDPAHVFVISIPDWGVTPFAEGRDRGKIAGEIDAYNTVKQEETLKRGIRYFNITPISREAESTPELIAADGLHPSGLMYQRWVEMMLPDIHVMLKEQDGNRQL